MATTVEKKTPAKTPAKPTQPSALHVLGTDDLATAYGWAAALNDYKIKDAKGLTLSDILNEAGKGQWTQDLLNARVQEWVRTSGVAQSQAQWEAEKRLKPVDSQVRLDSLVAHYQDEAKIAGAIVDPARLKQLADHALAFGLPTEDQDRALRAEYHYNPNAPTGAAATTEANLKALAKSYLVPVSDDAIGKWVDAIAQKTDTIDSFTEYLRTQAKSMFPTIESGLDAGHDTQTLLDPYATIASNELGIPAVSINLTDPKWLGGLMQTDPKTGDRTMPTLDQWQTMIRTDPKYGWNSTVNAQNMAADFSQRLAQEMGAAR